MLIMYIYHVENLINLIFAMYSTELKGRPNGFTITVNEARISAGAGFIVIISGNITTMPGLPKEPASIRIKMQPDGRAIGLS